MRMPAGALRAALAGFAPATAAAPHAVQRAALELAARAVLPRPTRSDTVGGVPGEWHGERDGAAILYLHGGGYTVGSPRTHRALAARLARESGVAVFVAHYRLAPEHPAPAALEDALAAFAALAADGPVAVAGDSAGGGLALALAQREQPAAVALLCPWLDAVAEHADTGDPFITPASLARWTRAVGDHPSTSPLRGTLDDLPPIVLHSAGRDPLVTDAERLAERVELEHRRHPEMFHGFHAFAGRLAEADAAIDALARSLRVHLGLDAPPPRVAIVGAGMSGLCMAAKLRAAGYEDFTLYEKADELGGTWRENTYPGLTCDVPARFYSYSFAPNPDWTSSFAPGPEILGYFRRVARDLGLRDRIRFGAEIVDARWADGRWRLRTAAGDEDAADVLVTATGVLHHPKLPDIPGRETFAGASFHTARWDHDVALAGRRVAVVGTGSTGVQIIAATAGEPASLKLFQRTPQWVAPVPNLPYPAPLRAVMRAVPPLNRAAYRTYQIALESILGVAVRRAGWQRSAISNVCRLNLRVAVRDPELRARLRPDYRPMCKRLVMSAGFYPALQKPGVELITEAIERIEPDGIVTADGTHHAVDVIAYATGFDAHAYVRPMAITGEDGLTIDAAWGDRPQAYRTVAVPGFPNLFMLMGPHSPVGNHSLIAVAETQAGYVIRWIERMRATGTATVAPTAAATEDFNAAMRADVPGTIWASGCDSWYLGADGVPEVWPWSPARHRALLAELEPADFTCRPA